MLRGVGVNESGGNQRGGGSVRVPVPRQMQPESRGARFTGWHRYSQRVLVSLLWPAATVEECRRRIALASREVSNEDFYVKSARF